MTQKWTNFRVFDRHKNNEIDVAWLKISQLQMGHGAWKKDIHSMGHLGEIWARSKEFYSLIWVPIWEIFVNCFFDDTKTYIVLLDVWAIFSLWSLILDGAFEWVSCWIERLRVGRLVRLWNHVDQCNNRDYIQIQGGGKYIGLITIACNIMPKKYLLPFNSYERATLHASKPWV